MERLDKIETNEEFLDLMIEAVKRLQNCHTSLVSSEKVEKYKNSLTVSPIENVVEANKYWGGLRDYRPTIIDYSCPEVFFYYSGGEYIAIGGFDEWEEKYRIEEGSKVIEINGINADKTIETLTEKTYVWYDPDRKKLFMNYLDPTLFGESAIFTIKNSDGNTVKKSIRCVSKGAYKELLKFLYGDSDSNLEFRKWGDKKTAYVRIRSFAHDSFEDRSKFLEFYKTIKDYNVLIIDIRGNSGGYDVYWQDNIIHPLTDKDLEVEFSIAFRQGKYVSKYVNRKESGAVLLLKDSISNQPLEVKTNNFPNLVKKRYIFQKNLAETPFKGDVYLLVDRWVYSAAESFAAFAKASRFATLVGTTTGGDGIGGHPFFFVLPNSKLVIEMSDSMGINPDGTANEETHTSPDIYFERTEWENDEEIIEFLLEEIIDQ